MTPSQLAASYVFPHLFESAPEEDLDAVLAFIHHATAIPPHLLARLHAVVDAQQMTFAEVRKHVQDTADGSCVSVEGNVLECRNGFLVVRTPHGVQTLAGVLVPQAQTGDHVIGHDGFAVEVR